MADADTVTSTDSTDAPGTPVTVFPDPVTEEVAATSTVDTATVETATPALDVSASGALAYTAVTDLAYATADKTLINATVTFTGLGELPYTLSAGDTTPHAAEIYAAVIAGTYGVIADYVAPTYTAAELEATARTWRDAEITASQWLIERHRDESDAGTATTLTADQYKALLVYRQALRDWPTVTDFPADSTKPVAPDWLAAAEAATDAA